MEVGKEVIIYFGIVSELCCFFKLGGDYVVKRELFLVFFV